MASRHSAARPKRAGENFARTHHNDDEMTDLKRAKFDVRNPSILAPDAREDDAILDADVIGGTGATKRGAVNLDGYDSDSDNENINARAQGRKKGNSGRKKKDVRFLDVEDIDGQDLGSKTGGQIRLDELGSSDDEVGVDLALQEEGLDEEVGAGGLKRNAPKVEAFNLKAEMEEGQFDQQGNYVRKAGDPDAVHDSWLEGLSKKEMKKAADAHAKREAEARKQRMQDDEVLVSELLKTLILRLERTETPLEALARLGKSQPKTKKIPKWKLKKMNKGAEGMEVDGESSQTPEQARVKESIDAITEAADKLLSRDYEDIYDQERELLVREYRKETGEEWVEPETVHADADQIAVKPGTMWEFRWTDGRDEGAKQGPFDGAAMKAWQEAGYFAEGSVEFRAVEEGREWTPRAGAFV
ncbi:hypothetical protein AUP68_16270 [Ilyonectria robusta]